MDYAKKNNFTTLKGEYIATLKNEIVKTHYLDLGFESKDNNWVLDVESYKVKSNHIESTELIVK